MATVTEESIPKWEGKAMVEVKGSDGAERVWAALEDFCNLHKWIPIDTSYYVEGIHGQPGLTRYCASTIKGDHGEADPTIMWAKEKLLTIDPIQRCLSYEIGDNNMGFKSYIATLKVFEDVKVGGGCKIEWEFVCDPVEGWKFEDLNSHIQNCLQFMANKVESSSCSLQTQ